MLVSILIPCFNAERWIAQAIDSALAQTWSEKEIIVVDDGSTDGSLAVIQRFGDRIRWETGPNRGGNAARNRLLELARGEWLQYLDADDYLLPGKVAEQMECLAANPAADVIYSPALFEEWADDNTPLPLQSFPLPPPHDPWTHLGRWRLPQTGGSLWRKQAIIKAGRWDEALPCCQEHELYLRLLECQACFVHCAGSGAVYRYWPGHTVSRRDPSLVMRTRLTVLERMAEVLVHTGQFTPARIRAINLTRFETARSLWGIDRQLAKRVMDSVLECEPRFLPDGPASRRLYCCLYRLMGFAAAEQAASWIRGILARIK